MAVSFTNMLAEKGFDKNTGAEVIICIHAGRGCVVKKMQSETAFERVGNEDVAYFVSPAKKAGLHDPQLAELVDALKTLLHDANAKRPDKNAKLGILSTPRGFVPVWKYEDPDTAPEVVEGSLTPLSEDTLESVLWPE